MIYCVLGISLRSWCLWYGVNCVLAGVFLSCHVLVSGCCVDGILSFLGFFVHFRLGCILFLASQGVVGLDCCLLVVSCLIDCVLSISLSRRRLWYGVNRVLTSIFLSCYILVGCSCIDGILSFLGFFVHLSLSRVFFLTS